MSDLSSTAEKRSMPTFWRVFIIVSASLVCAVIAFLIVFWNFIASYEKSLPESAVSAFLETTDKDGWTHLFSEGVELDVSAFESRKSIVEKLADIYSASDITFVKNYGEYSDESPVYTVIRDGGKFAEIILEEAGPCGFGFVSWKVSSLEFIDQAFEFDKYSAVISVPHGAELKINGIAVGDKYLSAQPGSVEYYKTSKYEKNSPERVMCDEYTVPGLIFDIAPEAQLDGKSLTFSTSGDSFRFDYPADSFSHIFVSAPKGAVITLGGVKVDATPVSTSVYVGGEFETKLSKMPQMLMYRITGLRSIPEANAEYEGEELISAIDKNAVIFAYPEKMMYSLKVTVPSGAILKINGIEVSDEYISETIGDPLIENKVSARFVDEVPQLDVYHVDALFNEPELKASIDGEMLVLSDIKKSGCEITAEYRLAMSEDVPEDVGAAAMSFAKSFMNYTSSGFVNVYANLQNALSHTYPGSEAYNSINASYYGVYFNDYYTLTHNRIEVTSCLKYSDNCYRTELVFDNDRTSGTISFHDEGTYDLILVKYGGRWCVSEFIMK